jgi:hypothetical protein
MEWLNLHTSTLDSVEFVGEEPTNQATWLKLLRFCAGQENGGTIKGCRAWKDRKWQQLARVTHKEANALSDLWKWDGEDLNVRFYPIDKELEIKANRTNGRKGGRPKKRTQTKPGGFESVKPSETTSPEIAETEGKGMEGNGKGIEGKECPAPDLIEQIRAAYPRQTHIRDACDQIRLAIARNDGNGLEILKGTQAIAKAVEGWTSAERLQFLPTPPTFFDADRWLDDPATWASKHQARLEEHSRPKIDIGGRKPAGVTSTPQT